MPTQLQYNTTLQTLRDIDCRLFVLDYNYTILDEVSGRANNVSLDINADSDVRRTANINMTLKDDSKQNQSSSFYWTAGNGYWFDKYLQIYTSIKDIRTQEYIWVNQGIYCINEPSVDYDASTNSLSFQAVDLMSKLTGMRSGYLEGMVYTIPQGSSISNAVKSILQEQGFTKCITYDPPQSKVPQDINIDIGETAYDLLCQLRDINSNWEFFFDVDGVFHFQKIPSGKVVVNNVTNEYGEPTPVVDHVIWDKTNIGYSINTDFSEVKNYVEVFGKVHNPNEFCEATIDNHTIILKTTYDKSYYLNKQTIFGFGIFVDGDITKPLVLENSLYNIIINDVNGARLGIMDISLSPIIIGNKYYCIKLNVSDSISDDNFQYLGGMQSHAVAIENNPNSPFYIGQSRDYITNTMNRASFIEDNEQAITNIPNSVNGSLLSVNISPWCSSNQFGIAPIGTEWAFSTDVVLKGIPVQTLKVFIGEASDEYDLIDNNDNDIIDNYENIFLLYRVDESFNLQELITNVNDEHISLDFSMKYMIYIKKTGDYEAELHVSYYPIEGYVMPMSTSNIVNFPKFNRQIRLVCTGGEYDNIYSDDLAQQRARYEIYLKARLHDSITINTAPIYWLDVNQIIDYTLPNNTTEENDYWLVKSISTEVSTDGTQSINAIRYYPEFSDISLYKVGRLKLVTDAKIDIVWSTPNYAGAQMPDIYDAV